jgi:Effector-associated domain 2
MPSLAELESHQKQQVADLFLKLPCFGNAASLQSVVAGLPHQWRTQLRYGQNLREDTVNLLDICAAHPNGFSKLLASVRFFDGGTVAFAALIEGVGRLGLSDNLPGSCWAGVPPRIRLFTGRDDELQNLRVALTQNGTAAICAVHGLGGVGKTTLATEYAHRYRDLYGIVGWFRLADDAGKPAQTEASVAAGYSTLAVELGLAVAQADYATVRRAVVRELARRNDWLLIFDNAEDPSALRQE